MSDKHFTLVFKGNIRKMQNNPLTTTTPFGVAVVAGLGDAFERAQRAEDALERIAQWADAYPLDVFPEPDWKRARVLLEAGGMTLDSVSAGAMRRVVEGVGKIARETLAHSPLHQPEERETR